MRLKDYLTAKEAAKYLGISRQRLTQIRNEGKIKGEKRGVWLYHRFDLEQYHKNRKE